MLVGCNSSADQNSDAPALLSGDYVAVGDFDECMTPYFQIDTEKNEFRFGAGVTVSYAAYGTYEVENGEIIAASPTTTFIFEIKDTKTLVLTAILGFEYSDIPINTQFVFSDDQ